MSDKIRYLYLKEKNICTGCKVRKSIKNRVRCNFCLEDDRRYRAAKREIKKGLMKC
ncbi:MAG: hypothetical protein ABF289_18440 [Clostridiales bacterium]